MGGRYDEKLCSFLNCAVPASPRAATVPCARCNMDVVAVVACVPLYSIQHPMLAEIVRRVSPRVPSVILHSQLAGSDSLPTHPRIRSFPLFPDRIHVRWTVQPQASVCCRARCPASCQKSLSTIAGTTHNSRRRRRRHSRCICAFSVYVSRTGAMR